MPLWRDSERTPLIPGRSWERHKLCSSRRATGSRTRPLGGHRTPLPHRKRARRLKEVEVTRAANCPPQWLVMTSRLHAVFIERIMAKLLAGCNLRTVGGEQMQRQGPAKLLPSLASGKAQILRQLLDFIIGQRHPVRDFIRVRPRPTAERFHIPGVAVISSQPYRPRLTMSIADYDISAVSRRAVERRPFRYILEHRPYFLVEHSRIPPCPCGAVF